MSMRACAGSIRGSESEMVANLKLRDDWRRPGCDARCCMVRAIRPGMLDRVAIESHDPEAHEEYGRVTAGPTGKVAVLWTGSLVIDLWRRMVVSDGRQIDVAGRQWEVLAYLAARLDRFCPVSEITAAICGEWYSDHIIHVFVTRLRTQLGANARLIETRRGHGYRLRVEPPVEVERRTLEVPARPWSRRFLCCVCCGKTDRPYESHGRCSRCRGGTGRRHYGPCGAPPDGSDGAS